MQLVIFALPYGDGEDENLALGKAVCASLCILYEGNHPALPATIHSRAPAAAI